MYSFDKLGSGVLPDNAIKALIENGNIQNGNVSRIQPSSLDVLPDLNRIYEIDEFYPPRPGEKIEDIITDLCNQNVARQLKGNTTLTKKKRYLVPLVEQLFNMPYFARNNPKSSPGRIFQHTRLLTDGSMAYDEIYTDPKTRKQWLFLSPKSFYVTLSEHEPLCQLRFFKGSHRLSQKDLDREMRDNSFISIPLQGNLFNEERAIPIVGSAIGAHVLSIDLRSDIVAYKTKDTNEPIDIASRSIDWTKYFEVIYRDQLKNNKLVLDIGEGYLFGSLERIRLPGNIAGTTLSHGAIGANFSFMPSCVTQS